MWVVRRENPQVHFGKYEASLTFQNVDFWKIETATFAILFCRQLFHVFSDKLKIGS